MDLSLDIQGPQSLKLVGFHQTIMILFDIVFSELNERMGDRKVTLMPYEEVVRLGEKRSGERKSAGLVSNAFFSELPLNFYDLKDVPLTCVFLLGFFNLLPFHQFICKNLSIFLHKYHIQGIF